MTRGRSTPFPIPHYDLFYLSDTLLWYLSLSVTNFPLESPQTYTLTGVVGVGESMSPTVGDRCRVGGTPLKKTPPDSSSSA